VALVVLAGVVGLVAFALVSAFGPNGTATAGPAAGTTTETATEKAATTAPAATTTAEPPEPPRPQRPSDRGKLKLVGTIGGDISPKSVVASGTGLFVAQNMMYHHTVTVYDRSRKLVKTIPDSVRLAEFGFRKYKGETVQGAPVEAAFSPDGRAVYVTNYSMYGPGFGPEGTDVCSPGEYDDSFVYRIDTKSLRIDDAIRVGQVPKYVATTPDGRYVLVTNWCSYDLSVIDATKGRVVETIPLGPYPRGIAVSPDSDVAYVAVMGTTDIAVVDLKSFHVGWIYGVGSGPRHVDISPNGRFLYVTLNGADLVAKVNVERREVVRTVSTGDAPRSMAIAADGRSLFVVNYFSNTVTKLRARDLAVLQTVPTNASPIGITYDADSSTVWVACYSGSIMVFRNR